MPETPSPGTGLPHGNERYEIRDAPIGQGGMGVVYKAYDTVTRRHVALKTMPGNVDAAALEMFEREWSVLARISHPNIIDILDTGKFEQDGQIRPYFVMPLLRGSTLDQLIKHSSERLTVDGVVDIISQVCRGLQAAHDQNLVHRDMKPSNIFVMDDDTIKIIDFGVAHLADTRSATGVKGTLQYMAPEQLEMKPPTPLSDIFSLAVVCYEALTGRRPFARKTDGEVIEAIRTYVPPPATEVNNAVNQMISRTVHKAMAKQSWHRFSNAREFGDTLRRALRNEPIERFDKSKIQPRIDRIKKAQAEGDYQFAGEILTELESEGHIDPEMSVLRSQIDQTIRQRNIRQLLESARTRIEEDELPLALQKIQSVLEIDPLNGDALALKGQVERQRSERQIENWFRVVRQHIENQDYNQARQGVAEILKINSAETRARELLSTIDRTEAELIKAQEEKQKLFDAALASYQKGEISTALGKLERLLEINRTGPRSSNPERDAQYQSLYNQVRSEHDAVRNAYGEARRYLLEKNFAKAREICDESLAKHPDDHLFLALKLEADETERQQESANLAEINRRLEAEPDLEKKIGILTDALGRHPNEQFRASLKLLEERRDLINSIVARARQYEDRNQLHDATGQWDILKNIYPKYPGLDFELERLSRRREEQARNDAKAHWVEQIDRHLNLGEPGKAQDVLRQALSEFPDDAELQELQSVVHSSIKRSEDANTLVKTGQSLIAQGNYEEGLESLRQAERLDQNNPAIRATLMSATVKRARELMLADWRAAQPLVEQAIELDGDDPVVRSLSSLIEDYKKQDAIGRIVVEARTLQASGDIGEALRKVEGGLQTYPNEIRLSQLYNALRKSYTETRRKEPATSGPAPTASEEPAKAAPKPSASTEALGIPPTVHTTFEPIPAAVPPPEAPKNGNGSPLPAAAASVASPTPAAPVAPPPVIPPPNAKAPVTPPPVIPPPVIPSPQVTQASSRVSSGTSEASVPTAPPNRSKLLWGGAAAAIVVIAAALLLRNGHKETAPTASATGSAAQATAVAVQFTSNVNGTHYVLDNTAVADGQKITAGVGTHRAEANLEGYASEFKEFTIAAGSADSVTVAFHLQPLLPELRINSDLKAGRYVLDGAPPADLQEGSLVRDSLPAGPHTLAILDGTRPVFSFAFSAAAKEGATLTAPLGGKSSAGVVVSSVGPRARIYGTPSMKGGVDGQPLAPIPPDGLAISLTAKQAARVVVDDGSGKSRSIPIDFSPAPVLSVFLSGATERIPLTIHANVPDGIVSVNGQPLKRPMADGSRTVLLPPGSYKIQVTRDGYQAAAEQTIVLKADETGVHPLEFKLAEIPRMATLLVESAPAGAEILIDGNREGTASASGSFSKEVSPGSHTILIHKGNYEELRSTPEFQAGATTRVAASSMKAPGTVNFKVTPSNATLSYLRDGETSPVEVSNDHSVELKPGTYEITAQAPNFTIKKDLVTVASGKVIDIAWSLKAKAVATAVTSSGPASVFENGGAWSIANGYWVHPGKGLSVTARRSGTLTFDLINPKDAKDLAGLKLKRYTFVADYIDPQNQVLYTLDSRNLSRKAFVNGKSSNDLKIDTRLAGRVFGIIIDLTPDEIVVRTRGGKLLDRVKRSGTPGRFGFVDEVAMQPQS